MLMNKPQQKLDAIRDGWGSETPHWRVTSCICVMWVSPLTHPLQQVLSLFPSMGDVNMSRGYDWFFQSIVAKVHIGPIFHKPHIFWTLTLKWHFSGRQLCSSTAVSGTYSHEIWRSGVRLLSYQTQMSGNIRQKFVLYPVLFCFDMDNRPSVMHLC